MRVRSLTVCAVMTALLLAVQYALSAVSGVELVTVLLLAFSYCFGARMGTTAAAAFSLLRCLLYPFSPTALVLYLLYYPAFAFVFGMLGKREKPLSFWACPCLLLCLGGACLYFAVAGVPVSVLNAARLSGMLWALFALFAALFLFSLVLPCAGRGSAWRETASLAALAALFTVCFTLIDDVLTPLWYGYAPDAAVAYFYAGFLAMVPQTICAVVSVCLLFPPLKQVFCLQRRAYGKKPPVNVGRNGKDMI